MTSAEEVTRRIGTFGVVPVIVVGAGIVLCPEQVDEAVAAGASFLVSPGIHSDVVRRARRVGVPLFPGVATASEALGALRQDVRVVKFFPAAIAAAR
jgi:2-dehydro-3-deoxyphosphogluconate aldolase / (4S)-4-hydroxy-2-oxoglutarate aldolase